MSYITLLLLIIIISVTIILSVIVFASDRKAISNQLFLFASISILLWNVFAYLGYNTQNADAAALFFKINYFAVALCSIAFYFFTINFPVKMISRIWIKISVPILFGFFALSSLFGNSIIKSVTIKTDGMLLLETGTLGVYFYIASALLTLYIFIVLIKNYHRLSGLNKEKVKFFLYGIFLYGIGNIVFNVIIPLSYKDYRVTQLGDFSAIFFLIFTAYAIVKHQLFNIKVIATETTVIALSIGLLIEVFLSNSITEGLLKGIVWVLATYGGWVLIKSVKMEIKQKEDLQVLSKKLDEANRHLEDLDEQKDNFISMASHELNTPIAAIEGYLSMIIDEKMAGDVNPKVKAYLENIYFSSKRLAALVRDLLNVSRIESGRVHLINEEASIEDVIEKSIAEVKIKADEVGHKLTFEKPKTPLPKTWFDVSRITEVMINIIGNAIKYTDPPGKITVSAHADDGKLVVAIQDNGRGIPKGKEDAIFEKFVQVEVLKDQVKGTGLGMFITKNLVELHKGKLWFKSSTDKADHGTTFYFSLPIYKTKPVDPHEGEGALFQKKPTDVTAPVTSPTRPPIPKESEPRL